MSWKILFLTPTNYLFLMKNLSGGFEVKANLNPATYDGESKIAFQVEKSVGGAPYQHDQ